MGELFTIEITASMIAWWGALTGTFAVGLHLWNLLRDRARIRMFVRWDRKVLNHPDYDPEKKYVIITVANRGRRPITIGTVGFTLADGTHAVTNDSLYYRELGEGKAADYVVEEKLLDKRKAIIPLKGKARGLIVVGKGDLDHYEPLWVPSVHCQRGGV